MRRNCRCRRKNGRELLSNVVLSQIDVHKLYGGVVPEIASRNHVEVIDKVCKESVKRRKFISFRKLTPSPLLTARVCVGALLVGVSYAKGLCQKQAESRLLL